MKRKGLSPVMATVLLVSIVIIIGFIVFLWFRGMSEEAITKFDGTNIKVVCDDVSFDASYSGGYIFISNTGNVPIYQIQAKISSDGSHTTELLEEGWPASGLSQGATYSGQITVNSGDKLVLIPVLLGKGEEGDQKNYVCDESQGVEVEVS